MQRRLGRRDLLLLTVICLAFVVLAIQLPFGTRGFDRPQQGFHWRLLEAPGRWLGWGGVALLVVAIPYALVAWLKGRVPGRAISALGALVFGFGIGGLAGVLASSPVRGGGSAGGALAHMLSDSLGAGFASALLGLIAIPGLFLSLAPLLLETGYVAKPGPRSQPADGRTGGGTTGGTAGGGGGGSAKLPPVLAKPWYPERHIGPDGEELPMSLGGSDVGPIRYRDPPSDPAPAGSTGAVPPPASVPVPAASAPSTTSAAPAARAPLPRAMPPPPPPPSAGTKKAPVISGVRYRDEEVAPPAPLTRAPRVPDPETDDQLPDGVRFAPSSELEPPAPAPEPAQTAAPARVDPLPSASDVLEATFVEEPAPAEAPISPTPTPVHASADAGVVAAWVAANPLPVPEPVESSVPSEATDYDPPPRADRGEPVGVPDGAAAPSSTNLHPSVVGHRRKLAESGIFEGTSPAADRPGRPAKPRPRPAPAKDWREALHGLFSSLPIEELPPIRVPDELVGTSAEEEARLRADTPGQLRLFDASETTADGRAAGTRDALFEASVDAALERGTASLVLLKRRLGVGYARAASLMDALVAEGVLGEMTASGSRPTLLTQAEWNRRKKR